MKKLSADQLKRKHEISTLIDERQTALDNALIAFNQTMAAAWGKVDDAMRLLNEAASQAEEFRSDIVSEMDEYASERSEKWSESDAGSAFESWKSEWENASFDGVELDQPEEVIVEVYLDSEFDNLQEEVSE